MTDSCSCDILEYKKLIPDEEIHIGDIVMLDASTGLITRSVLNKFPEPLINDDLVVGVCINSWLDGPIRIVLDGGTAKIVDRELLDAGKAGRINTIILNGGNAKDEEALEVIQVAYDGVRTVNITGRSKEGDKLVISPKPGKATARKPLRDPSIKLRTLGKIIGYIDEEKTQATVLLNIE